ncbi:MAG: carboxypeptidase M32 [Solirubrobacterales bacterium]
MQPAGYTELRERLAEVHDLDRACAVLAWDERTKMPSGGAAARADQLATLARVKHYRLAADEIGRLLDGLSAYEESLPHDSTEASLIRVARRDHQKARRVPPDLEAELARAAATGEHAWREARERRDFGLLLPHLRRNVELRRQYVDCFPDVDDPYDALLDDFEPGMKTTEMERLLGELKDALLPLTRAVLDRSRTVDDSFLYDGFDVARQRQVVLALLQRMPIAPGTWRLDDTAHPFATAFSPTDVRITTRYSDGNLSTALFSALHEMGHGLYESGVNGDTMRTPLCRPVSLGMHESQSRTWENLVGRSRAFWRCFYDVVARTFPERLEGIGPDGFYRAVNKVRASLVRVEADELTYDLHVLVRFELERAMFAGTLDLADLPEAWNERVREYLHVEVPNDSAGVLQDVHWAEGLFGYFPTYSLGNIIAGQLWKAAHEALPDLEERIEQGELTPLRDWLREHVHRHGRKLESAEIVERATGRPIEIGPYVSYLRDKYGAIYGLEAAASPSSRSV